MNTLRAVLAAGILAFTVSAAGAQADAPVPAEDSLRPSDVRFPAATGFVTDAAGMLDQAQVARLEAIAAELKAKTGAELAIAVVPSVKPLPVDEYAVELFGRWSVGERGKDNGILLVVAAEDREMWIEVGYGLEGAVPDAIAHRIYIGTIVPAFRAGQYGEGLEAASAELARLVASEYGVTLELDAPRRRPQRPPTAVSLGPIIALIILILLLGRRSGLLWWLLMGGGNRNDRHRGGWGGGWGGGGFGGFGGGSSGGGFGGFGGGMTGGGGAGGRW